MGPLSQNEILILAALGTAEQYGREITDEVARITDGRYRLSIGGLYTTLHRMEKKKLVAGRWGEKRAELPEAQRRYYRITAEGRRALVETRRTLAVALRLATGGAR
jgi:PadR family transcriptional regulator PadR